MPPSLPTATQVVDPEAQETARTFGRGEYDAVVFQVGAVGPAPAVEGVASSPTSARVVTVESVATPILLTVDTASPLPPGADSERLGDRTLDLSVCPSS